MAHFESETAQKLISAFQQFRKTGRQEKKIGRFNPSEFRVLALIQRAKENNSEMKVSEISQKLRVTPPTVTQIINVLEKDGFIERTINQEDRRAVKIRLTEAGIKAAEQARKKFSETFLGLVDYLGEKESQQLADLLFKVHDYFEQLDS
ncbi:MarR family winged helix-turn-helix transcriptional regulator [Neobacillus cucumis]|uniref:MarR family winged helix-turn-helix transcriptional regulator n=1 Tax=Neobacillus cucumis TaxID=1740721 RepID=UPI001962BF06|nr:MarR family transcriptional regulator [Neobacillus cucumis]MBM7656070.1 DNA-binding MarR family transcriptional regulator [Neobacillus cucumis]